MKSFACLLFACLAASLLLAGCGKEEAAYQPEFADTPISRGHEYSFGIYPQHNPKRLFEVYSPLMDYLNAHIPGAHFQLEASRNYEEFEKKLYTRKFAFVLPNPYQTVKALKRGYHVFGKMGDDDNFRGLILIRRDSGIRTLLDLKGKKVSYPAKTELAATMMPQYYLSTHGLNVNRDTESLYVGSQESSILNAYLGNVAAAATWQVSWITFKQEHPGAAADLRAKWRTEPLINSSLMARNDMPPELVKRMSFLIFHLQESKEGRAILKRIPISRFELADDTRYGVVRDFLAQYNQILPQH